MSNLTLSRTIMRKLTLAIENNTFVPFRGASVNVNTNGTYGIVGMVKLYETVCHIKLNIEFATHAHTKALANRLNTVGSVRLAHWKLIEQ